MDIGSRSKDRGLVWGIHVVGDSPASRKLLWGVFLMVLGGALTAGQLGLFALPSLWKLWPIVLFVMAVGSLLDRRPGSAASLALVGLAFFAAQFRWFGLSFHTFWPLLVVAVGVGIVVGVLSGEDAGAKREA
jgi:hypothetical protein